MRHRFPSGNKKSHSRGGSKGSSGGNSKVVKEPEYEVEDVVAYTEDSKGVARWKVRWKGYESDDDTWETRANLRGSPAFWKQMDRLQKEWRLAHKKEDSVGQEEESVAEEETADPTRPAKGRGRGRRGRRRLVSCHRGKALSDEAEENEDEEESEPDEEAGEEDVDPDQDMQAEEEEDEDGADAMAYPIIYGTDTEPPPHHLPDETVLTDGRLSIFRFKNIPIEAVQGTVPMLEKSLFSSRDSGSQTPSDADNASAPRAADAGDSKRALSEDEDDRSAAGLSCGSGAEEQSCVYVQYLVDGKYVYSIPFERARFYCPQLLLSYLMARTTFKTNSVTATSDKAACALAPGSDASSSPTASDASGVEPAAADGVAEKSAAAKSQKDAADSAKSRSKTSKGAPAVGVVTVEAEGAEDSSDSEPAAACRRRVEEDVTLVEGETNGGGDGEAAKAVAVDGSVEESLDSASVGKTLGSDTQTKDAASHAASTASTQSRRRGKLAGGQCEGDSEGVETGDEAAGVAGARAGSRAGGEKESRSLLSHGCLPQARGSRAFLEDDFIFIADVRIGEDAQNEKAFDEPRADPVSAAFNEGALERSPVFPAVPG
ncbi:chrromatin organization modifier domain-containing protein [Besnoitia besnoiti]|uniref:Chrromatin organization modifier domain-containing protein n=1 Tax=Besnoitia besnoiti TaxID=94643 RepID=A0A2A9MDV7_BESBE|nr:chrromatin organization modifier domain-containing protein [Besnoitia besnoiti]PFH34451.1 chrromatin organization modifier domain-containing protein [Besnoitia besnoiti]